MNSAGPSDRSGGRGRMIPAQESLQRLRDGNRRFVASIGSGEMHLHLARAWS